MLKPQEFFGIYSGKVIDAILIWLQEKELTQEQIDWIGWRISASSTGIIKEVEVEFVTAKGEQYVQRFSVDGPIVYQQYVG